MVDGVTVLGAVAAVTQLAQNVLNVVQEILRAAKDLKDVPKKTEELITQFESVDHLLRQVLQKQIDPTFLKPIVEELELMLTLVDSKKEMYKLEDTKRKGKNQSVELIKNLFQQGGAKQKKKVAELSTKLQKSVEKLKIALIVEIRNNSVDICELLQCNSKESGYQKHDSLATPMPTPVINDMFLQLKNAADFDYDNESYHVKVEFQNVSNQVWETLEGELAGDAANATGENTHRASIAAGYRVQDGGSLRFTMSVNEHRLFHFLTYSHSPGAGLKLFHPTKSNMKHAIEKAGSKVFFPCHTSYKGPRRWGLNKDGSSRMSTESVFLILSINTLMRAEAQSSTGVLEISDIAEKLEEHLAKKLDKGSDYDEIIVKHFPFDIFAVDK